MRPFLKWAGGKRRLVPQIEHLLPPGRRLIEPFFGSGAVTLGMDRKYAGYVASDINADLIELYGMVMADAEGFINDHLRGLFSDMTNTSDRYYDLRGEFNSLPIGHARRNALFIYLNRHCFNGLCRYNASGDYNVPYGKVKSPYFPADEIREFEQWARSHPVTFRCAGFHETLAEAGPGDVVYCDPPYLALSVTASFDSYASGGFSMGRHQELARLCREAAERGAYVVLSNHDTPDSRKLYDGARFEEIQVTRSISGNKDSRGKAKELLVVFDPHRHTSPARDTAETALEAEAA